ncbi:hypothetical protein EYF80_025061 [Liparis tanakae]|uniref:Uncharacterized protein n=1 Tax=Liparis tanakae TaxID=230148 RepID=A0A4Z2HHK8_9TELE|nr:hypothetical protein EYF80_025061 [Liparis tanakae]
MMMMMEEEEEEEEEGEFDHAVGALQGNDRQFHSNHCDSTESARGTAQQSTPQQGGGGGGDGGTGVWVAVRNISQRERARENRNSSNTMVQCGKLQLHFQRGEDTTTGLRVGGSSLLNPDGFHILMS